MLLRISLLIIIFLVGACLFYAFQDKPYGWRIVPMIEWKKRMDVLSEGDTSMKVAVVCYDDRVNNADIEKLKRRNQAYCNQHGYDFLFFQTYKDEDKLPPYWRKVRIVKDILEGPKHYDYVMWIDSDACVFNMQIRIETVFKVLSTRKTQFFLMAPDNFPAYEPFNAGVWIVRNIPLAKQFMGDWIRKYNSRMWTVDGKKWHCFGPWAGIDYEQGSGAKLLSSLKYRRHVICVAADILQSHGYSVNAFTFHFYGFWKRRIKNM